MKNLFTAPGFALVTLMMIQPTALLAAAPDSPAPVTADSQASQAVRLPAATVGRKHRHALKASGGTPPYTFAETSGQLKSVGLSITSDGVLNGVPTKPGNLEFTVAVHDSTDQVHAEQSYRLRVLPPQMRRQSQKSKKQIQGT